MTRRSLWESPSTKPKSCPEGAHIKILDGLALLTLLTFCLCAESIVELLLNLI